MRSAHAELEVPAGPDLVRLSGDLTLPNDPLGVVVFAHGSGSSRLSPRNRMVAANLSEHRFATLLIDLLSPEEDESGELRFAIGLLASRVCSALDWLSDQPDTYRLPVGVFGASTGAAAALIAASERPETVRAVVSRGGRPDLAANWLPTVRAPTLLVVGERDLDVLELNRQAMRGLVNAENRLAIVPNATHLFEEHGALERVVGLAQDWFARHLP